MLSVRGLARATVALSQVRFRAIGLADVMSFGLSPVISFCPMF